MLNRGIYIEEISTKLAWIKAKVELCSSLNLLDSNIHMEYFLCGLLNTIYGYHLKNLNTIQSNYISIDLGDTEEKVAIQVTSDNSSTKIKETLHKFIENKYDQQFNRLVIIIIGNKKAYTTNFVDSSGFQISKGDIWDFEKVMQDIAGKGTSELEEIANYLDRELVNANGYTRIAPIDALEEMNRKTRALCLSKLMTTGLSKSSAEQIMEADVESTKYQYIIDAAVEGKRYLVGGFGTGKSHAMLILCQQLIQKYLQGNWNYIPLYTHVRDIVNAGSIEAWMQSNCPRDKKYCLFIDGLDEIQYAAANQIISEEQYLSMFFPENIIIIGSRPLSYLPNDRYLIDIRPLSATQRDELIDKILSVNRPFRHFVHTQFEQSLSRPLFCIIYALLQNSGNIEREMNEIDILSIFVDKAAKDIIEGSDTVYNDLLLLSIKTVDRGLRDIHISEITLSGSLDSVLKTGLVSKQGDYLSFPIVIIAQFLAAKALQKKTVDINPIIQSKERLDYWKYPLSILFAQSSFDESFDSFAAIIRTSPGTASQIIRDGIRAGKLCSLQTSEECGKMIFRCMEVWCDSLGELAQYIAPIHGSSMLTLGVCVYNSSIIYTWFESKSNAAVIVLSRQEMLRLNNTIHFRVVSAQSTWPWIITLDYLSDNLKKRIAGQSILGLCSQLNNEAFWDSARVLSGKGTLNHDAISVKAFEKYRNYPRSILRCNGNNINMDTFFTTLDRCIGNGLTEIKPPFPTGDRECDGFVWSCYSSERYLELTKYAFSSALASYTELVETVFYCFKDALSIAQLLPCKIVGGLEYDPQGGFENAPGLTWYLEALPRGSNNDVDIEYRTIPFNDMSLLDSISRNINESRPESNYRGFTICSEVLRLNNPKPVTNIVYKWLESELRKIGWLKK